MANALLGFSSNYAKWQICAKARLA